MPYCCLGRGGGGYEEPQTREGDVEEAEEILERFKLKFC